MNFSFDWGHPESRQVKQWKKFHHENPKFYALFVRFSLQAVNAGRKRFSARTVIHRIRWYTTIDTQGDAYKVNNNWSPFYARLFEHDFPEHDGFFEMRSSFADAVDLDRIEEKR